MWHNLKIVLVSFPLSVLVTATTIWVCHRRKWLVQPREDRWSRTPVAHFGGVGLLVVFLLISLNCQLTPTLRVVVMLTAGMGVVGFLDDALDLPTRWKFAAQYFLCTMAVAGGVLYPVFRNSTADIVFSVIWLMALTNAFNLLDNMDGLAAGVSIIVVLNLVLVMRTGHVAGLLTLLLALEGCLLGFLLFNFHPAKIFMGDTGSLAIGFFLGCAGVINATA